MPAQQLMSEKGGPANKARILSLPYNPSSQHLMAKGNNDFSDVDLYSANIKQAATASGGSKGGDDSGTAMRTHNHITRRQWITVLVLFFVNLINYMDRLTIAGILTKIQAEFKIGDAEGGALQTAFVASYMIFAPIFGYTGDRHSRKLIMAFGVFLWTVFTIVGSFMQDYTSFLLCRAMVGIGEASYSTIAPTIISDMFVKDTRSKMLALFYFAIPVGSGLGYVVGSETTNLAGGDWRWGLRVTPILGLVAVFFILFLMTDPPRGESEGHGELKATTYTKDIKCLARNKSFIFSTIAFTCVTFCTGALSWWGPKYIESAVQSMPEGSTGPVTANNVSLIFGFVTMLSGIVGVPLGSILSTKLKQKYPRADPIICGCGLLLSAVLLGFGMFACNKNIHLAFILLFLGEVALNLNWSIVADVLLYVVVPTRRGTAEAIQILISHAFGDAGSPYLIGIVSDSLRGRITQDYACPYASEDQPDLDPRIGLVGQTNQTRCDFSVDYYSMQYSMFINNGVEVVGGLFFLLTALYIIRDKLKVERYIAEETSGSNTKLLLSAYPAEAFKKGESESSVSIDSDEDIPELIMPLNNSQETGSGGGHIA